MSSLSTKFFNDFQALNSLRKVVLKNIREISYDDGERCFDFNNILEGANVSVNEIDNKFDFIVKLIPDANKLEKLGLLIPELVYQNLNSTTRKMHGNYNNAESKINIFNKSDASTEVLKEKFSFVVYEISSDQNTGEVIKRKNLHSFHEDFIEIYNSLNIFHRDLFTIILLNKKQDVINFTDLFTDLKNDQEKLDKLKLNMDELINLSGDQLSSIEKNKISIEKELAQISNLSKSISELHDNSDSKNSEINEIHDSAESLKEAVDSYQKTFVDFQEKINNRIKEYDDAKNNYNKIVASTEERSKFISSKSEEYNKKITDLDKMISDQIQNSEKMLNGATVAGLASTFKEIQNDLKGQLSLAKYSFYFGIGMLFISALPLVGFVIPIVGQTLRIPTFSTNDQQENVLVFSIHILARAMLLLPGVWLTKFAAARHYQLFSLKEHYSYKYSIAASVDAFKKQSELFSDAITASSFFQLSFNPADKMDAKSQSEKSPNIAMDWIMEKFGLNGKGVAEPLVKSSTDSINQLSKTASKVVENYNNNDTTKE